MEHQAGKACWGVTLRAMLGFVALLAVSYAIGIA
jgi:hypothetical protein